MTLTITRQQTYTVADVNKAFESFRSNLRLFSNTSGVDVDLVDARADDVLAYARAKYLTSVHLHLRDSAGTRLRAAEFTVSADASGWKSDMPGDNFWPHTPGGSIRIILCFNDSWHTLSHDVRQAFKADLKRPWGPSDEDLSYTDMVPEGSRRYASNAYGLQQNSYRRKS